MQHADKEILQAMQTDNRRAFELMYRHYYADLCVYALRFMNDDDDASELVQKTMVCLWENQENIPKAEYTGRFLFRCVHNACIN